MNIDITYEQALEKASPRLRRLMEHSYEVLRKGEKLALFYDPQDGYWCGFSGGKDSQALYHMAQLSGVKFKAFFSPTSIDPPEVIRFIRKHYPEVSFTPLKTSIFKMFESKKTLPSMRIRWCCAEFKEKGGEGKVTLVGVRHSESARRANRCTISVTNHKFNGEFDEFEQYREDKRNAKLKTLDNKRKKMQRELRMGRISEEEYKQFDQWSHHEEKMVTCVGGKDKIVVSPILEWEDTDVWEFLNNVVEVPHCELYDQGSTRIGCIGCPMATSRVQRAQFDRWPHVRERWIKSIMKVRKQSIEELNKWYKEDCNNTPPPNTIFSAIFPRKNPNVARKHEHRQDSAPPPPRIIAFYQRCRWFAGTDGFSDGSNDYSSFIGAYNEEEEREIAENILDWWISKLPYNEWYAKRFSPRLFDDNELEI